MAAQFLTISRLSNIISMITLGQQSGILRVVRGQGNAREVGQIKFVNGAPTSALLGQRTGTNALSVLSNWGECVYSFEELPPDDGELAAEGYDLRGGDPNFPSYGLNSGPLPNVSWPTYSFPSSAPMPPPASPAQMPTTSPLQGATSQPGYWPNQPGNSGAGYGNQGGYPQQGEYGSQPNYFAQPSGGNMGSTDPLSPYALRMSPRRTMLSEQIDQLPLDRRERMVLLLVDGQRNLSDLARLTRRSERELLSVLEYLSGLGLVTLQG